MGIRIHKVLGYGLDDMKYDNKKNELVDDRINPDGYLGMDEEDADEKYSLAGYTLHLDKQVGHNASFERLAIRESKNYAFYESILAPNEFSEKVLCVVPLGCVKDWRRFDDSIDYHEECARKKGSINRVQFLENGIYPYIADFCDVRTGEKVKDGIAYLQAKNGRWKGLKKQAKIDTFNALAIKLGFKDMADIEENMRPVVPECVQYLCEYLEIFKQPETVRYLKPMVYIYWS